MNHGQHSIVDSPARFLLLLSIDDCALDDGTLAFIPQRDTEGIDRCLFGKANFHRKRVVRLRVGTVGIV